MIHTLLRRYIIPFMVRHYAGLLHQELQWQDILRQIEWSKSTDMPLTHEAIVGRFREHLSNWELAEEVISV